MSDVYISCAREDRQVGRELSMLLERSGLTVFFDMEVLVGGEEFNQTITNALRQAKAVVVLLSANTNRSTWVQHELSSVIEQKYGPLVIPVLLDRQAKENWVWPLISNRQAIDLSERRDKLEDVADQLQRALGVGGELYTSRKSPVQVRFLFLLAAIAITLLGAIGTLWFRGIGADSIIQELISIARSPFVSGALGVLVGMLFSGRRK